jgi:hypothetical protein
VLEAGSPPVYDELMAFAQSPKAKRSVEEEQRRDRAAHREIVRLNRARGVAANLEDALRLHRAADAMHGSVRRRQ